MDDDKPTFWSDTPNVWEWDVFGGGLMVAKTPFEVPWWRRVLTRIFLGSTWRRLEE
jgi:hypothetical protein